jgi:hypothetical protein
MPYLMCVLVCYVLSFCCLLVFTCPQADLHVHVLSLVTQKDPKTVLLLYHTHQNENGRFVV